MLTCEPLLAKRVRVNSPKQASVGQVLRAGGEETKKHLSQKALKQSPTKNDEHFSVNVVQCEYRGEGYFSNLRRLGRSFQSICRVGR